MVPSTVRNLTMPFSLPRVIQYSWKAPWLVRASRHLAAGRFRILVLLPLSALCRVCLITFQPWFNTCAASLHDEGNACLPTSIAQPFWLLTWLCLAHCPQRMHCYKNMLSNTKYSRGSNWGRKLTYNEQRPFLRMWKFLKHCKKLQRNKKVWSTTADAGKLMLNTLEETGKKSRS